MDTNSLISYLSDSRINKLMMQFDN